MDATHFINIICHQFPLFLFSHHFVFLGFDFQQFRTDFGNQWAGAYYGGPVYDGYGYALPPHHDPSMYAAATAAYGAYPVYGTHQQQVS